MTRVASIDRLRGLAILLMVADHALAMCDTGLLFRFTVTRLSLPLFMFCAGWTLRNRDLPSLSRFCQLLLSALLSLLLVFYLPFMAGTDILAVFVVAVLCWPIARLAPFVSLAICLVATSTIPVMWDGYHLCHVLGLMLLGPLLLSEGSHLRTLGDKLPAFVGRLGQYPLSIYCGHLGLLSVVYWLFVR